MIYEVQIKHMTLVIGTYLNDKEQWVFRGITWE